MSAKAKYFVIVGGCLVVAFVVLLPSLVRPAHTTRQRPSCINNLRMIEMSKAQWRIEQNKTINDTPTWDDLRDYLRPVPFKCPNGGEYTIGRIGELPMCSIPKDTEFWKAHYP